MKQRISTREFPTLAHQNYRLEEVLPEGDYTNVEFTYEAKAKEICFKEGLEEEVQAIIAGNVRSIITPAMAEKLGGLSNPNIKVLASPLECGRLVEVDQSIILQGRRYTLTIKGVGCTQYAIDRVKAECDKCSGSQRKFYKQEINKLEEWRMFESSGVMLLEKAYAEMQRTEELSINTNARIQQVLAVAEISDLIGSDGKYLGKEGMADRGLGDRYKPALIFRAMKSNFRVLDLCNLLAFEMRRSAERLAEHGRRLAEEESDAEIKDFTEYAKWFVEKFLQTELPLLLMGYGMSNTDWQTEARNISIMAEEIDLESVTRLTNRLIKFDYLTHLKDSTAWADLLNAFVSILIDFDGRKMKQPELDELVIEQIKKAVNSEAVLKYQFDQGGDKFFVERSIKVLTDIWLDTDKRFQVYLRQLQEKAILNK